MVEVVNKIASSLTQSEHPHRDVEVDAPRDEVFEYHCTYLVGIPLGLQLDLTGKSILY